MTEVETDAVDTLCWGWSELLQLRCRKTGLVSKQNSPPALVPTVKVAVTLVEGSSKTPFVLEP